MSANSTYSLDSFLPAIHTLSPLAVIQCLHRDNKYVLLVVQHLCVCVCMCWSSFKNVAYEFVLASPEVLPGGFVRWEVSGHTAAFL